MGPRVVQGHMAGNKGTWPSIPFPWGSAALLTFWNNCVNLKSMNILIESTHGSIFKGFIEVFLTFRGPFENLMRAMGPNLHFSIQHQEIFGPPGRVSPDPLGRQGSH